MADFGEKKSVVYLYIYIYINNYVLFYFVIYFDTKINAEREEINT